MNRMALGLAIGAGYVLGRTKKAKMALAAGSLVAGKKLNLTPRGVADLLSQQLKDNPQFKEIGDQLRQDLRGVGKAASGAMVERKITALADRLHSRTSQVRDQIEGVVPDAVGARSEDEEEPEEEPEASEEEPEEPEAAEEEPEEPEAAEEEPEEPEAAEEEEEEPEAVQEDEEEEGEEEEQRPARKAARKAPAKKAVRRAPAKKTAAKKNTAARKTATKTASRFRGPKGGR